MGGPVLCQQGNPNQCYQPSAINRLAITKGQSASASITASQASLVLIINQNAQVVTITNHSTQITAYNIRAILPASWTDVIQDASSCTVLAPGASCQISFTPGSIIHSVQLIPIQGDNTSRISISIEVKPVPIAIAGGQYTSPGATRPLLAFSSDMGTSWTFPSAVNSPVFVPDNTNSYNNSAGFFESSCDAQTCIAVGQYRDAGLVQRPLLAVSQDSGLNWIFPSSINAPVFSPVNTNPFSSAGELVGATCQGSTCIAAGTYFSGGIRRPIIAISHDSGTSWSFPAAINAPVFTPDNTHAFVGNGRFNAVTCHGAICIASGLYSSGGVDRPLLAVSQDLGLNWTYPSAINAPVFTPDNSNAFSSSGALNRVSCQDSVCIATGEYRSGGTLRPLLALSQNAAVTWTYPSVVNSPVFTPDNSNAFVTGTFTDVNCQGTTCIAVGTYFGGGLQRPLVAVSHDSGTNWTFPSSVTAPVFTPDNTNAFMGGGTLLSISCQGSDCVTGGFYNSVGAFRPLLAVSHDAGSSWTFPSSVTSPVFTPDNTNAFTNNGLFYDVHCAGGLCIAAGYYINGGVQRPLLAVSQDLGLSWTFPSVINSPVFTPDNSNTFLNGSFSTTSSNGLWLPRSLSLLETQ
ncbi:sialidase family protein [Legionella birminghamensis]|uniref:sialidase family protein n=1 Tax=Legionella birminghamensis TaxID=28083 RepID=UPI001040F855|nr:sialidase family protein [Legionella birminghamensis]